MAWFNRAPAQEIALLPSHPPTVANGSRIDVNVPDGQILLASDCHYSPTEPPSTAHRAFVAVARELQPQAIILNGDVCDFPTISKHPRADWSDKRPTVVEEIAEAQARLREIERAAPHAQLFLDAREPLQKAL